MSQVGEHYITGSPSTELNKARQGTRQAVRVDPTRSATRGNPAIPVDRISGTDDANEVIGEYKQFNSDSAIRVQDRGILHLEAKEAYAVGDNGQGVLSSDTAGLVKPSGTVGTGFGSIIGGYSENGKHYLIVYTTVGGAAVDP